MAATKRNAMLIEEARQKIRTTQLINRLQGHALGKVKMEPTQVRACEILLRKSVPDLTATTLSDPEGRPIEFTDLSLPERARRVAFMMAVLQRRLAPPIEVEAE